MVSFTKVSFYCSVKDGCAWGYPTMRSHRTPLFHQAHGGSLLEHCRRQQRGFEKQCTPFVPILQSSYFAVVRMWHRIKWGWLVFLVGQKPNCLVFDVQQEPSLSTSPRPRLQKV